MPLGAPLAEQVQRAFGPTPTNATQPEPGVEQDHVFDGDPVAAAIWTGVATLAAWQAHAATL